MSQLCFTAQGIHAAGAEALKVAVGSGKAKQTANLAAEIVRLGWTSFVSCFCPLYSNMLPLVLQ